MTERFVSHYRITRKLGAGGMGEVHLADDTKLERQVALKLLPSELAQDSKRRQRFLTEAKAASALNHPNVCVIHEVGESDNRRPFIAMEFLEGQTLESHLRGGSLDSSSIINIGVQIADALDAAHAKGIIHRDIKPSNICVNERGQVKVLDFGLAKRLTGSSSDLEASTQFETQTGQVLGTPNYMSPEQALGKGVDHRTDLFSLGVVLYQMASTKVPFAGPSFGETMEKIVHAQPEAIARFNYDLTPELERIILKLLEKEPERRYQSARDLYVDLNNLKRSTDTSAPVGASSSVGQSRLPGSSSPRKKFAPVVGVAACAILLGLGWWISQEPNRSREPAAAEAPLPQPYRIAVLPLNNISPDPSDVYFSDGMTEELITTLSKVRDLAVIARGSVMPYRNAGKSIADIGKELQVGTILEGSVRKFNNRILISVQLINAETQANLWAESYDRQLKDVFAIQQEVAKQVAAALRIQLLEDERIELARIPTEDLAAYDLYLLGRHFWNRRRADDFETAIEYFKQALEKDPNYAKAYAGLADCYNQLPNYSDRSPQKYFALAETNALKAIQLDDSLAEAHASLGFIYDIYKRETDRAEDAYKRAIELNPNYPSAHHWYAFLLLTKRGLKEQALTEVKMAQSLAPRSLIINSAVGDILLASGQFNEAVEQYQKVLEMDPSFQVTQFALGAAYLFHGDYSDAITTLEPLRAVNKGHARITAFLASAYGQSGNSKKVEELFSDLQTESVTGEVAPFSLAIVHAAMGNHEQANSNLEQAHADKSHDLLALEMFPGGWSVFDQLNRYPQFEDLKKRIKADLHR